MATEEEIHLLPMTAGDSDVVRMPKRGGLVTTSVAALAAFVVALAVPVQAQGQAAGEYEIKAAFLYNFTKFVEWPPEAFVDGSAPIVMAVLGPDPFGSALDEIIEGKQINGRPLVIRRLQGLSGLDECHVLFVSPSKAAEFARLLRSLSHRPTLTVGETDGFADAGGIIQLVKRERKIRFRINVTAADEAGLKISSRLLNLADVVRHSMLRQKLFNVSLTGGDASGLELPDRCLGASCQRESTRPDSPQRL